MVGGEAGTYVPVRNSGPAYAARLLRAADMRINEPSLSMESVGKLCGVSKSSVKRVVNDKRLLEALREKVRRQQERPALGVRGGDASAAPARVDASVAEGGSGHLVAAQIATPVLATKP